MSQPYVQLPQIQTHLETLGVQLTSESGDSFGDTKAEQLLSQSCGFINGYLSAARMVSGGTVRRYVLPIPDSATITREILSTHTLNVFVALSMGARLADNAVVKSLFDATVSWLRMVATSKDALLPTDATTVEVDVDNTATSGTFLSEPPLYSATWKRRR